jgi:hypothetical protein
MAVGYYMRPTPFDANRAGRANSTAAHLVHEYLSQCISIGILRPDLLT